MNQNRLNVLILAAGLGTRLRPLTNDVPKPLVPVVDKNILEIQQERARSLGDVALHANAHYLAEQVVAEGERLGFEKVWVEEQILGTAGPLKRIFAAGYRGGLLVMNGDAYCNFDLHAFVERAKVSHAEVALLAVDFPTVNTFRVSSTGELVGIVGRFGSELGIPATFSGVSWYSDEALSRIKEGEFDIREFWKQEMSAGRPPFVDLSQKDAVWIDMGSPAGLKSACDARLKELNLPSWNCSSASKSVVQKNVALPQNFELENSILFEGAAVEPGERVVNEIRGKGFSWKI